MQIYNIRYRLFSAFAVVLITAGCSARLSFDELIKDIPSNVITQNYSRAQMKYSISVPKTFELDQTQYDDTTGYESFIDTLTEFEKGATILSVFKYDNSKKATLAAAWTEITSNRDPIGGFRILSNGKTDYLSKPAYYEHSACVISEVNMEAISFLISGDSSCFYLMTLQVNTEKDYPDNIEKLLYCAKSLKISL